MAAAVRLVSRVTPEARHRLEAEAIERGCTAAELASRVVSGHVGSAESPAGCLGRGRQARLTLARLADRGGWFTREQAGESLGAAYCLTGVYLREMVDAGLLVERVVPGASGGLKVYASTCPQNAGSRPEAAPESASPRSCDAPRSEGVPHV